MKAFKKKKTPKSAGNPTKSSCELRMKKPTPGVGSLKKPCLNVTQVSSTLVACRDLGMWSQNGVFNRRSREAVKPEERGTALALCSLLPLCCGDPLDRCAFHEVLHFINFFGWFFFGGVMFWGKVYQTCCLFITSNWRCKSTGLFCSVFRSNTFECYSGHDSSWSRAGFYVL